MTTGFFHFNMKASLIFSPWKLTMLFILIEIVNSQLISIHMFSTMNIKQILIRQLTLFEAMAGMGFYSLPVTVVCVLLPPIQHYFIFIQSRKVQFQRWKNWNWPGYKQIYMIMKNLWSIMSKWKKLDFQIVHFTEVVKNNKNEQ